MMIMIDATMPSHNASRTARSFLILLSGNMEDGPCISWAGAPIDQIQPLTHNQYNCSELRDRMIACAIIYQRFINTLDHHSLCQNLDGLVLRVCIVVLPSHVRALELHIHLVADQARCISAASSTNHRDAAKGDADKIDHSERA